MSAKNKYLDKGTEKKIKGEDFASSLDAFLSGFGKTHSGMYRERVGEKEWLVFFYSLKIQ